MKPIDGYDKLRGGYYTPASIADFIVSWALRDAGNTVLEPSCGDGSFLASIRRRRSILPAASDDGVTGIELDPAEADKANSHGYSIVNSDFFTYYRENIEEKTSYDVIVGIIWSGIADKGRGVKASAEPRAAALTPLPLSA